MNGSSLGNNVLILHASSTALLDDDLGDPQNSNAGENRPAPASSAASSYKQPMIDASSTNYENTQISGQKSLPTQVNFKFEPYQNREPQTSAVKLAPGFRKDIDPATKEAIENDLIVLANAICKKYGVNLSSTFRYDEEKSGDQSLTLGVMFSVVDAVGRDQLGRDFLRHCSDFGLHAWMYGEIIKYHGEDYLISGLDLCRRRVKISNHSPSVKLVRPEDIINYFNQIN